jgi:hypothetical protein
MSEALVASESAAAQLLEDLRVAADAGETAILSGNTGDLFMHPDGPALRLPELVATAHTERNRKPIVYSPGVGARTLSPPGHEPASLRLPPRGTPPWEAVPELVRAVSLAEQPIALILDHAEQMVGLAPSNSMLPPEVAVILEALQQAAVDPQFERGDHVLVLISRSAEVSRALSESPGFRVVRVQLPTREDRVAAIRSLTVGGAESARFGRLAEGLSVEQAAEASGGLRIDDLMRIFRESAAARRPVDLETLRARKALTLRRNARDVLRLGDDGRTMAHVAGLPHVRRYIQEHVRSGEWPSVILFCGPPGVGKTFCVQCIAGELKWPLAVFHQVRSPWVGESEANTLLALDLIRTLRPIIVHIDEVDQELQRSTGPSADGGTSERFTSAIWQFTGEPRRDQVFCLTTNRPDLIDTAMIDRAEVIPVLHPTVSEVAGLIPVLATELGRQLDEDVNPIGIARLPELRLTSARTLIRILKRAATLADLAAEPSAPIRQVDLIRATEDHVPNEDPLEEEYLALKALSFCRFRSLLPWEAGGQGDRPETPYYVDPLLDADYQLVPARLRQRLDELEGELATRRMRKTW